MSNQDNITTFLLADDHSMIRQGLVFIIEDIGINADIFHASNLQQVTDILNQEKIDIAIIDAHFPDGNSLSVIPEIHEKFPDLKILIYTGIDEHMHSLKYISAGANGFLNKLSEEDQIQEAIIRMYRDGEFITPETQTLLMNSLRDPFIINPLLGLSEREREIAELYAEGLGNLEIANKLDIKQNTVSTMKKRIFEKLHIENLVELIQLVKEHQS